MTTKELLNKIIETNVDDSKLYFITRTLRKGGINKKSKMIGKYQFMVYQVDIDDEIRQYLFDVSKEELEYVIKNNFEVIDYDIISDDIDCVFTYSMKNKTMSFANVVNSQLNSNPEKLINIKDIIISNVTELWAYCTGFNNIENKDWIYTFCKLQPGKIAIDEKENQKKT